jgi:hypothetical protein
LSDKTTGETRTQATSPLDAHSRLEAAQPSVWTRPPNGVMVLASIATLTVFSGVVGGLVGAAVVTSAHDVPHHHFYGSSSPSQGPGDAAPAEPADAKVPVSRGPGHAGRDRVEPAQD